MSSNTALVPFEATAQVEKYTALSEDVEDEQAGGVKRKRMAEQAMVGKEVRAVYEHALQRQLEAESRMTEKVGEMVGMVLEKLGDMEPEVVRKVVNTEMIEYHGCLGTEVGERLGIFGNTVEDMFKRNNSHIEALATTIDTLREDALESKTQAAESIDNLRADVNALRTEQLGLYNTVSSLNGDIRHQFKLTIDTVIDSIKENYEMEEETRAEDSIRKITAELTAEISGIQHTVAGLESRMEEKLAMATSRGQETLQMEWEKVIKKEIEVVRREGAAASREELARMLKDILADSGECTCSKTVKTGQERDTEVLRGEISRMISSGKEQIDRVVEAAAGTMAKKEEAMERREEAMERREESIERREEEVRAGRKQLEELRTRWLDREKRPISLTAPEKTQESPKQQHPRKIEQLPAPKGPAANIHAPAAKKITSNHRDGGTAPKSSKPESPPRGPALSRESWSQVASSPGGEKKEAWQTVAGKKPKTCVIEAEIVLCRLPRSSKPTTAQGSRIRGGFESIIRTKNLSIQLLGRVRTASSGNWCLKLRGNSDEVMGIIDMSRQVGLTLGYQIRGWATK